MEKFEKNTNCAYCQKPLEAKYRSKKFCDDKCRIYFNREEKKRKKRIFEAYLPEEDFTGEVIHHPDVDLKKHKILSLVPNIPPMPQKEPGEDSLEFAARKNEWKQKYGS